MDRPKRTTRTSPEGEAERKARNRERRDNQDDRTDKSAETRKDRVDIERLGDFPLFNKNISVKGLRDGRRRSRRIDQDRGNTACPDGRIINAKQDSHALRRLQPEGQRRQDRNTHRGGKAGQRTDDHTGHNAEQAIKENICRKNADERRPKQFHMCSPLLLSCDVKHDHEHLCKEKIGARAENRAKQAALTGFIR